MNLKEYMAKNKLTLQKMGQKCDIPLHTIGKYKNKIRIPRKNHMCKIFRATCGQVTPNDFYECNLGDD
jgi:hypothetical protein